jgi:hypothetical protein
MKDRLWQIVGAIAAIIAVIVAIIIFYLSDAKMEKSLLAEVISSSKLINTNISSETQNLKVFYRNKEIPNVIVSTLRIINDGKQPIRSEDYESPIIIRLNKSDIISSKVISKIPNNLKISLEDTLSSVLISKTLLNAEDQFLVEIVSTPLDGKESAITSVEGRIVGIKNITFNDSLKKQEGKGFEWFSIISALIGLIAGLYSVASLLYFSLKRKFTGIRKL